jgi:hypothetical protein
MSLLVVGSIALDSIFTPFGETADALGGSAVYFSVAASLLHPVRVVGVVGNDYPVEALDLLGQRGIDWSGVERADGESFRWKGKYSYDLQSRETLETRLGVFAAFQPKLPAGWRDAKYVFLGNIDPVLQLNVLDQMLDPKLVVCDTMNYWIKSQKPDLLKTLDPVPRPQTAGGQAGRIRRAADRAGPHLLRPGLSAGGSVRSDRRGRRLRGRIHGLPGAGRFDRAGPAASRDGLRRRHGRLRGTGLRREGLRCRRL